ncbi:MAG: flagellar biosynthesis protein FlhB [Gemmatimonadota bacterium]
MAEESFQEKTEQATPKRRDEARQKGQVARSAELSSVGILAISLLALWGLGGYMFDGLRRLMVDLFTNGLSMELDPVTVQPRLLAWMSATARIIAPMVALLGAAAVLVNIAQVGILFTGEPLLPKGDRINPLSGLKRIFSQKGLVELVKGLFKVAIVAYVTYLTIRADTDQFVGFVDMEVGPIFAISGDMILSLGCRIVLLLLLLAVLDYAFQRWEYERNLRMTRQEVREELKQQEGDPMIRARVRAIQREMSQRRMMGSVGQADVVVTNPTHLAVALKYDPAEMDAPVVLAKGQRLVAERIKELARESGVPLVENKPLAQALFKTVQIGQQIPEELFRAVAEVLAFVFQLKRRRYAHLAEAI